MSSWIEIPEAGSTYSFVVDGDGKFKATFAVESHTVKILSGKDGTVVCEKIYVSKDTSGTIVITKPTKTGYSYFDSGWNREGVPVGVTVPTISDNILTIPANANYDFTMYPTWSANTYVVTLNKEGGVGGLSSAIAVYDSPMTTGEGVTAPSKSGYAFLGYFSEDGVMYYTSEMKSARNWDIAADTTLHAHWSDNTGIITTVASPASAGTVTGSGTYENGSTVTLVATPVIGYEFSHWSDSSAFDSSRAVIVNGNATYTAVFTETKNYKLTFDNAGGAGSVDHVWVDVGDVPPTVEIPIKPGYAFTGYYYGGIQYYNNDGTGKTSWTEANDATLVAQWLEVPCTIHYRPGTYGIGEDYDDVREAGVESITLRGVTYTRSDAYTQNGWAIVDGGEKKYDLGYIYVGNEDLTLYPHWGSVGHKASFYVWDGASYGSPYYECAADNLTGIPDAPVPDGMKEVRYGPYLDSKRNGVSSLTVLYAGNTYVLARSGEDGGRTLGEEDSSFLDSWEKVISGSGSVKRVDVVFKEYDVYTVTVTVSDTLVYEGTYAAVNGKSDALKLSAVGGTGNIEVVVNTSFIDNSGDLEFYALYKVVEVDKHTATFWHYDTTCAKTAKYVEAEVGTLINAIKPTTPTLGSSLWSGGWSPTISSTDALNGNVTYEYEFTSGSVGEYLAIDWNKPSVSALTVSSLSTTSYAPSLTWGHEYPELTGVTIPTVSGYGLKYLKLIKLSDSSDLGVCYNSKGEPCAIVTTLGLTTDISGYVLKAEWVSSSEKIDTLDDLRSKVDVIPKLFAEVPSSRGEIPFTSPSEDGVNFKTGFTSNYNTALPGGKVITRRDMNMLGHYGSQCQFFEQCGGYHTFDSEICTAIGGYPKGAILNFYDEDTNEFRTVKSLVNDNEVNFLTEGVDGVNWKYVDVNPQVNVSVDYSDYLDLGDTLFVESGTPDLYEVPYDSYLQLFAVGTIDCTSLKREQCEDTEINVGVASYDEETKEITYITERVNGMYRSQAKGISTLDVYHNGTQSFGSTIIGGFYPYSFTFCHLYVNGEGEVLQFFSHHTKLCPISSFSAGIMLSKGDKIRVRNSLTDVNSADYDIGYNYPPLSDRIFTDDTLKRLYTVRFANLYRRGVSI